MRQPSRPIILSIALAIAGLGVLVATPYAAGPGSLGVPRWEHKVLRMGVESNETMAAKLDKFSDEGWELVAATDNNWFFKRPRP
jgi:hypothetical protein